MKKISFSETVLKFLLLFFFFFSHSVCAQAADPSLRISSLIQKIPPRPPNAMQGSEFADFVSDLSEKDREEAILHQLLDGNLPGFLRKLQPVHLNAYTGKNKKVTATVFVLPDYLSIGSDKDFIRIPMNYFTATAVAQRFGFVLPTKKIVDAIYHNSGFHLKPLPMKPGPQMRSTHHYRLHNSHIRRQRQIDNIPLGELLSGHKKDVVITNRLRQKPGKEAIYGWHRLNGIPIQPLSTVHGARYADYSHGVRLVSNQIMIGGKLCSIFDIFRNPELAKVICDEGPIPDIQQLLMFSHVRPWKRTHSPVFDESFISVLQHRNPR